MQLAKVLGTVVATVRDDGVDRPKYLLVEQCDTSGDGKQKYLVALDTVGAGPEEIVLLAQGSSARQTALTHKKAIDAVIVGIVDSVEDRGRGTYKK